MSNKINTSTIDFAKTIERLEILRKLEEAKRLTNADVSHIISNAITDSSEKQEWESEKITISEENSNINYAEAA